MYETLDAGFYFVKSSDGKIEVMELVKFKKRDGGDKITWYSCGCDDGVSEVHEVIGKAVVEKTNE